MEMTEDRGWGGAGLGKGLFVTDLDGTLLNDQKRIDPEDLAALARLRRMGILVVLATGRSNHSLAMLWQQLGYAGPRSGLPVDQVIFSTGAGIMDFQGGKLLRSLTLTGEDVRHISGVLEGWGLDYMIHKPVPETRHFLYSYHGRENPDFLRRLELYGEFATPISPAAVENFGGATEVLCIADRQTGHALAARISLTLRQFSVIKATSPLDGLSIWIEIFAPAVSKSRATAWLATRLGVARERVCAIGNDYNDEDLLHWAGNSFVVAKSPATMQALFPTVASNNGGGVSEAVNRWLAQR